MADEPPGFDIPDRVGDWFTSCPTWQIWAALAALILGSGLLPLVLLAAIPVAAISFLKYLLAPTHEEPKGSDKEGET